MTFREKLKKWNTWKDDNERVYSFREITNAILCLIALAFVVLVVLVLSKYGETILERIHRWYTEARVWIHGWHVPWGESICVLFVCWWIRSLEDRIDKLERARKEAETERALKEEE